jgi:hypothetical protein
MPLNQLRLFHNISAWQRRGSDLHLLTNAQSLCCPSSTALSMIRLLSSFTFAFSSYLMGYSGQACAQLLLPSGSRRLRTRSTLQVEVMSSGTTKKWTLALWSDRSIAELERKNAPVFQHKQLYLICCTRFNWARCHHALGTLGCLGQVGPLT